MGTTEQNGRVLIVGDSLTTGRPGVSYVNELERMLAGKTVVAAGRGGDTLSGVVKRMAGLIARHSPQVLILQVGANDIVLPHVAKRGAQWQRAVERLATRGSLPAADIGEFCRTYDELVERTRGAVGDIGLITIPCAGEDLWSDVNEQRVRLNDCIRGFAQKWHVHLIDVAETFERELTAADHHSAYLLEDFNDLYGPAEGLDPDSVSLGRKLQLTIDGVHLNTRGARLFAATVARTIEQMFQKT